ncbi:MAG: hypothetical protein LBS59_01940 [Puniceicoccales bacterium]|jgi:hypothetical protein|nr:hypothetical protein [Puniceicoccales bacterium]
MPKQVIFQTGFKRCVVAFAFFIFSLVPGTSAEVFSRGLVGHWTFDGADAVAAGRESASRRFHAKLGGNVRIVPGIFGNAVDIAGKNEITVAPDFLPVGIDALTISAWIAPRRVGDGIILRKEDGEMRILFALQNDKFLTLGLACGRNYAECDAILHPSEVVDGKWHFVAGSFDGKVMRVFLDGRQIGAFPRNAPLNTIHDFVAGWANKGGIGAPLYIGSLRGGESFDGKIDDVRFYATALSSAQIDKIYAAGSQKTSKPAIAARAEAKKIYRKGATFIETLSKTARNIPQGKTVDALAAVEIQRLLLGDFPEETNHYITKWQRNPVEVILLSETDRNDRAKLLAKEAFEYLPLTDFQWNSISLQERAKWRKAEKIKTQIEKNASVDAEGVLFLEYLVEKRPMRNERVAPSSVAQTPPVVSRSKDEAVKVIENEWLFQCKNKPTVDEAIIEISRARKLLVRLGISGTGGDVFLKRLAVLETEAKTKNRADLDPTLYFAVRTVKREIMLKNPVIDFDSVLYIDNPNPAGSEWNHETRHRLGYMSVSGGGRLLIQKGLGPDGKFTQIAPIAPLHGSFWRPDLSYDASKVVFSFKPHNEKTFHLYEIGIDGKGLRQLTGGMFDDLDPIYLPDGKNIMFITSRGHIYVRCMPPTNAYVTARMPLDTKPGDKNLYIVSRNGEPEYTPSVLNDGRIIYTRWEYTDKPLWRAQSLWTMNQDGTNVQTFWGNQSVWPDLLKDARSIPGSKRIMFTGSAHHNWFSGCIGIIDPTKGLNFPNGLTKVTQELHWPESGNGPVDPKESNDYRSAPYAAYDSPYPLSEKDFLVSARKGGRGGKFVLLLMDTDGNREIINEGAFNIRYAIPIRKRPVPRVQVDKVNWPTWEERNKPGTGHIYSNNVYENAPPELKGKAKYLRIWSIEHKTYTYWYKRPYVSSGPEVSAVQSEGVKKIIGTVPIEEDGSVSFNAPSGIALHFQLLDGNQRALQTMKSFTGVQPGETRACFGCHEQKMNAPVSNTIGKALRRSPSNIRPVPWDDISVGYERYVQPVLDKHCGGCHADEKKAAYQKFNSKLRPGFLGFKEPYMTLLGNPTWGSPYRKPKNPPGGFGWADTILVESYSQVEPAAYATYPPMKRLSYKSRLVERMAGGKHYGVKVSGNDLLRVIHWVDAMGPYNGAEEIRDQEDPSFFGKDWISQRPRIRTAPIVPRPGPFDPFFTDTDPAYFTPALEYYNKLPYGVARR